MVHLLGVKPPTGQRKNALPQRRVPTPCGGGTRRAALAIRDMPLSVRVTTRSISFSAFIFGMVASFPIIGKRPVNATSLSEAYSRPSDPSESPKGDDYPLEFYPDGYPMLPDGLKR
jgi:hypothetical protein